MGDIAWGLTSTGVVTTVSVGQTVTWRWNVDAFPHTVSSPLVNGVRLLNSGIRSAGASYNFTFTQAGTYPYSCLIHTGLTGTVIVVAPTTTVITTTTIPVAVFTGDFPVSTSADAASLNQYGSVTGTINLSNFGQQTFSNNFITSAGGIATSSNVNIRSITFVSLVWIQGNLAILDSNNLQSVSLNLLEGVTGDVTLSSLDSLPQGSFPQLTLVGGSVFVSAVSSLTTFSVPLLRSVGGNFVVNVAPSIQLVNTQVLTTIAGDLNLVNTNTLTLASFPLLQSLVGTIDVNTNAALNTLSIPALTSIGGDVIFCANAASFIIPSNISTLIVSTRLCYLGEGNTACGAYNPCGPN